MSKNSVNTVEKFVLLCYIQLIPLFMVVVSYLILLFQTYRKKKSRPFNLFTNPKLTNFSMSFFYFI